MYEQDLKDLIEKVKKSKAEFQTVELKNCKGGVTEKLFDTLSSFSNQDDGGIITFGIDENSNYGITGIDDVQQLPKKVMEQCMQMESPVKAVFTVIEIDGKNIVAAELQFGHKNYLLNLVIISGKIDTSIFEWKKLLNNDNFILILTLKYDKIVHMMI